MVDIYLLLALRLCVLPLYVCVKDNAAADAAGSSQDSTVKPDRMLKLAAIMHEFNAYVNTHPNLRSVMLPLRDGLTVCIYNKIPTTSATIETTSSNNGKAIVVEDNNVI